MGKKFQAYNLDQPLLLPPDRRQWSPERHLALFLFDEVNELDPSEVAEVWEPGDGRGQPPYPPVMLVTLSLYAYCTGKASSRRIERATYSAEWALVCLTHNALKLWRAKLHLFTGQCDTSEPFASHRTPDLCRRQRLVPRARSLPSGSARLLCPTWLLTLPSCAVTPTGC
jgi:hypothetical protein